MINSTSDNNPDGDFKNYDDVTIYGLTPEKQGKRLLNQNELTFIWTTRDGHGMGVTMNFDGGVMRDTTSESLSQ